jgi:anti-sigma regulatory factor (Ser/Thr protein kinase)
MTPSIMEPPVHLHIQSRPELLARVRGVANAMAARCGLDDLACCHLVLAMDEALTNVIRHGYQGRVDGDIWITLTGLTEPAGIRVEILDRAEQVDPQAISGRDLEDVRPGGLGLHLMRTLVDTFEHNARAEGGMRVLLEKRATPATTA